MSKPYITNQTIIIKIINYLTSFWESSSGRNNNYDYNELFTLVMNNVVRDLSLVSKEWYYKIIPRSLKLPSYYLMDDLNLENNKSIKRMIESNSVFIKLGSVSKINLRSQLLVKYASSICSIYLKPVISNDISKNLYSTSPWIFENLQTLELKLGDFPKWDEYILNLFPINQFNSKTESTKEQLELFEKITNEQQQVTTSTESTTTTMIKYNYNWSFNIKTLILDFSNEPTTLVHDLSIFNNFIKLGGFYNLETLKLRSNLKQINGLNSELTRKVENFYLFGIRIDSEQIDQLLNCKENKLKVIEISHCGYLNNDKPLIEILSNNKSNNNNKLQSFYQTSYSLLDLNRVIEFLSSSSINTFRLICPIELSKSSNGSSSNQSSSPYQESNIQFLTLTLPDPTYCSFIFSKVSFKLTSINLTFNHFYTSNLNDRIDNDNEMIEILLKILKNQESTLKIFKIKLNDLSKFKKSYPSNSEYPKSCSFKEFFNLISSNDNIEEIDFRNIWISNDTIISSITNLNENVNSKLRSFYISGLSNFEANNYSNLSNLLLSNNCKFITFGISLFKNETTTTTTTPSSTTTSTSSRTSRFFSNLFQNRSRSPAQSYNDIILIDNYFNLLLNILNNETNGNHHSKLQHLEINTPNDILQGLSNDKIKKLLTSIKNNKTIVSIGLNTTNNDFINQCLKYSIYPFFNPPSINQ